jgi:penicillin amidase
MLDLWNAGSVAAAGKAASRLAIPANWLLAGRDGSIAFQQSGLVPKRIAPLQSGLFPVPAWEAERRWRGTEPPSELSSAADPSVGFLATANDDRAFVNLCMGPYRRERIEELLRERLAARGKLSVADLEAIQGDLFSLQAARLMPILRPHLPGSAAGHLLGAWDLRYDARSMGAVLFERVYAALLAEVFGERLFGGEAWRRIASETFLVAFHFHLLDDILTAEDGEDWFGPGGRDALVARVVNGVLADVDPSRLVPWGDGRSVVMKNVFFDGKLPAFLGFDHGPITVEGGRATIVQGQIMSLGGRTTTFCPSWRFVADLSTVEARTALAGGPSDRRFSRYYRTDVERWLSLKTKTIRA